MRAVCGLGMGTEGGLQVGDFKPQELANTTWAFATFVQADAKLFATVAPAQKSGIAVGDSKP